MKKILTLLFALLASPVAAQVIPSGSWGSINYWGVGGLSQVLNPGLAGQCLYTQGVGNAPLWAACAVGSMSNLPSINTNQFYGNVSGNFAAPVGVDVNTILNTVGYDIARPPAVESILYKSNVGPAFNWQTLPPGTTGSVLTSGGGTNPPFWATPTQASLASICQTVGAVLYFDTPSLLWKCLAPGTSGQLLQTGGAAGNPSWLTVTLATLGGVPTTRNINTTAPLGGGGALSSDLTLTCATCATTTNGGALSGTLPIVLSAAGAISMANQGTTTTVLHGNASGNPTFGAVALATDVGGILPAANLPAGVDTNALAGGAVITSAPTVNSTFCGTTAALGGNAFYAFTVGAASGFTANCVLTVANTDGWASGRGKSLSVSGLALTSSILYPGQVLKLRNINSTWVQDPAYQFAQAPLNQKLFVDLAGSDNNDCMATGAANACLTLQHVVMQVIWGQLLATGGSATGGNAGFDIRLATDSSCVITTGVNCHSGLHFSGSPKQLEGFNSILIECDGGSATNCTIADTVNAAIGVFHAGIAIEVKNVTLAGGGANNADIATTNGQVRVEGGVVLAPNAATSVALLQADGLTGKIVIEGGTTNHIAAGTSGYLALATYGGQIIMDSATWSFDGNVTFNQQTLSCQTEALVSASSTTWTLNAHTVTTAHNINTATGCWVVTNGASASVPGTNAPIGTLTSAGNYN